MVVLKRQRKRYTHPGQLELSLSRPKEQDRNRHLGGRSFYFFDFDDNVVFLSTPIVLFHKITEQEIKISSGEFARESKRIGKEGPFKDHYMNFDDETGSFRYFRDTDHSIIDKLAGKKQSFVSDIEKALGQPDYLWKAPSWNCFYHATFNQRPLSVITARGHNDHTIKEGIDLMVKDGHLPVSPNYLSVFPVSNPETRKKFGDPDFKSSIPELKRKAIRESVEQAIVQYGHNPHHRFGMSDDDQSNIELITEEMRALKRKYSEMKFFVIQTFKDSYTKNEVLVTRTRKVRPSELGKSQLTLF